MGRCYICVTQLSIEARTQISDVILMVRSQINTRENPKVSLETKPYDTERRQQNTKRKQQKTTKKKKPKKKPSNQTNKAKNKNHKTTKNKTDKPT